MPAAPPMQVVTVTVQPKKMKVAELRAELKSRGLPASGVKDVLLSRLTAAIACAHNTTTAAAQPQYCCL